MSKYRFKKLLIDVGDADLKAELDTKSLKTGDLLDLLPLNILKSMKKAIDFKIKERSSKEKTV